MVSDSGYVALNLLANDKEAEKKAYDMIKNTDAQTKLLIKGEEEKNNAIYLSRQPEVPESERQGHMTKILNKWGVNKGLWLNEIVMKQQIDKIAPL